MGLGAAGVLATPHAHEHTVPEAEREVNPEPLDAWPLALGRAQGQLHPPRGQGCISGARASAPTPAAMAQGATPQAPAGPTAPDGLSRTRQP